MAVVKQAGNISRSTVYAAETDARAAKKTMELEAGSILLEQSVKQAAKEREMIKREQEAASEKRDDNNRREDTEPRDTPELSKQSKWFGIEGKLLEQENIQWSLEMEEVWEVFLSWLPVRGMGLSEQLSGLSDLYMELLEALLTHTVGEEQAAQRKMLDAVLAQKLSLLMDTDIGELMEFLEEAGQTETINSIKADLYKKTTGERMSSGEAARFFSGGRTSAFGSSRYFVPDTGTAKQEDTGVLYMRSGARSIQLSQEFTARKNSGEQQMDQRVRVINGIKGQDGSAGASAGKSTSYTGRELIRANGFAGHITGSGNLLSKTGFNTGNEEAAGFLAGITAIKGQVYSEVSGRDHAMNAPVKSALNQFIDYYLTQKGMYKTYYYTTNAYERTGSVQKAVEEGLEYAYRQFLEKKNGGAYRGQNAYAEQSGFFRTFLGDMSMEEDLRRGLKLLEENWKAFLRSVGEEERKDIFLTFQKHSRWGELLRADLRKDKEKEKQPGQKRERIMAAEAVCAAAVVIVYILCRLFFG